MILNNFLTKLEIIEPRPTEAIILYANSDGMKSIEELGVMLKIVQKEFPNNKVICISDKVDLKLWDRGMLENYINTLNEILEEL